MKNRTVKLNVNTTLPTHERYCDGCPALGERFCNHLNDALACEELTGKTDRLLCKRHYRCPFNPPVCYVCKGELIPKQINDGWIIEHQCDEHDEVQVIAGGKTEEDAVENFGKFIVHIGRAFRQR